MSRNWDDPLVAFVGNAFMGIGAMMIAVCGTCTAFAGVPLILDLIKGGDGRSDYYDLSAVGVLGVVPTLVGVGLYLGGSSLSRSARGDSK